MKNNIITLITDFIKGVGIDVFFEPIAQTTFLPGIAIRNGALVVDTEKLAYPGDMLHEAGHIAVLPAADRPLMNDNVDEQAQDGGNEMAAIAWSYAACRHLGIDPYVVFHADGYKGGGESIVENFNEKRYFGLPLLQYYGMTYDDRQAANVGCEPYPNMINWLSQH